MFRLRWRRSVERGEVGRGLRTSHARQEAERKRGEQSHEGGDEKPSDGCLLHTNHQVFLRAHL